MPGDSDPPADAGVASFHPQFTTGTELAVFESSDGVLFRFNLHLLSGLSTFFNGLLSLPVPEAAEPIPLALADADTLALCFSLILQKMSARPCPPANNISWPPPSVLVQVIHVVRAYDLPIVSDTLLHRSRDSRKWKTLAVQRFILAAATESPYLGLACCDTLWCDPASLRDLDPGLSSMVGVNTMFELLAFHRIWADGIQALEKNLKPRCSSNVLREQLNQLKHKLAADNSMLKSSERAKFLEGVDDHYMRRTFREHLDALIALLGDIGDPDDNMKIDA